VDRRRLPEAGDLLAPCTPGLQDEDPEPHERLAGALRHSDDHGGAVTTVDHRARETGQALVEFALVLPVFLLIVFGVFDLGRAVYAYNTVANAAREGARVAAVNQIVSSPDCNESKPVEDPSNAHWSVTTCAAASAVALGVRASDVTVWYDPPPSADPSRRLVCPNPPTPTSPIHVGCIASVTVVYAFTASTPVIGGLVGTINMSATSTVPVERVFP
jgi:Flp pilus assembly protein TadG